MTLSKPISPMFGSLIYHTQIRDDTYCHEGTRQGRRPDGWYVLILGGPFRWKACSASEATKASVSMLMARTEPETKAPTSGGKTNAEKAERGEKTAENIRYGQKISEEGMGGQTTTSSGSANTDGRFSLFRVCHGGVTDIGGCCSGSRRKCRRPQ